MSTCTMALTDPDPGLDLDRWHRSRDRAALERLMSASLDQAYTQARRTLGDDADAQDAVQEALIQVMRSAHTYDPARPFAPWLARLVHVACCRLRWRARRMKAREQAVAQPDETQPVAEVDAEAVRAAVADLPERDRAAIELHYWAGLPQAEVARELGVSENALAVRLHRARERLRDLFARRGVSVGAAAVVAALAPTQVWAAPLTLAANVQGLGTAALPATSIPLGVVRETAWAAMRHPWWAAGAAVLLTGAIGLGAVALLQAEPPSPPRAEVPPAPVKPAAATAWAGPEREILRWLDPQAPVRAAVDLTAIRRTMLAAKPLSLFTDPQARPAFARLRTALDAAAAGQRGMDPILLAQLAELAAKSGQKIDPAEVRLVQDDDPLRRSRITMLWAAMESGEGIALSLGPQDRGAVALSLPVPAMAMLEQQLREQHATLRPTPPDLGSPGWFQSATDAAGSLGIHGRVLVVGQPESVRAQARVAAATAEARPERPDAVWVRADLGPLIAAYAAADPERRDPAGVGLFLGPGWRTLAPLVEATAGIAGGEVVSEVRVTRALPCTPFNIGMLIASFGDASRSGWWPILPSVEAAMRSADPARIAAPPSGALLWATLGLQPAALTGTLAGNTELMRQVPGLDRLLPLCSGDVSLAVEPGAPLPAISVVLGLSGKPDPALVGNLAAWFGLTTTEAGPGCLGAWQGFTPLGQVQVLLAEGRVVVSTASEPRRFLAPATSIPEAPLVMHADLPRLMATYGPLLLAQLHIQLNGKTEINSTCLPPLAVLARHLAVWQLAWTPTPDGCRIHERGLPLLGVLTAAATMNLVACSDPAKESASGSSRAELLQAMQVHQLQLDAVAAAAASLASGGPFTDADREALRPLFAGRLPTAEEVGHLGQPYPAAREAAKNQEPFDFDATGGLDSMVQRIDEGLYIAYVVVRASRNMTKASVGMLVWAMPLGDGWSIGIANGSAGLFKGAPLPAIDPGKLENRF